ncbi:MAG: hypothetical protein AAB225_16810 [Acidobacteriota bacterium]
MNSVQGSGPGAGGAFHRSWHTPEQAFLVESVRHGDSAAEAQLAGLYRERVFAMAVVRTRDRDAAADLAHQVILTVLLALRKGQLRERESLAAFVHGTARNPINNHIRSQCQRREEPLSERLAASTSADGPEDA